MLDRAYVTRMVTRRAGVDDSLDPVSEVIVSGLQAAAALRSADLRQPAAALSESDEHLRVREVAMKTLALLSDPLAVLGTRSELVILDEVQRLPGLFPALRGLVDRLRREGSGIGRFLLLGSSSFDLLRQSGETLAGRIAYRELRPFDVLETGPEEVTRLWCRGGFPGSFLAASDSVSFSWRQDFVRTYLERDIPALGNRLPAATLRRFWTMLAHGQGQPLNVARLASSLALNVRTCRRYLDLLEDLLLLRPLLPWSGNLRKRLVRSPKIYLRDSGVVHALLGLHGIEDVLSHPVAGPSWEGFVIENLLAVLPPWVHPLYFRTHAGAEVDLILEFSPVRVWAIEIKRSTSHASPSRGFHVACEDLKAERRIVIHCGHDAFPQPGGVETLPLRQLMQELAAMGRC